MEFDSYIRRKPQLNIAPLIDVVFLLIIFFMLSSRFIQEPGIKLNLPKSTASKVQDKAEVIIYVTDEKDIFVNDKKTSMDHLRGAIKSEMTRTGDRTVIIKSDEDVNLGFAVSVMDKVKDAEAEGLVLSTEVKEK